MKTACPSCGAEMDLDVLLAAEESRQAVARLCTLALPLARVLLPYIRLFRPASRAMSVARMVSLLDLLWPDLQRQAITRAGRDWPVPHEAWQAGIETVLAARDAGKLVLPLKSHGYLYEVLAAAADKAEAQAERTREADRKARRDAGPRADAPQPVATALHTAPPPPPAYIAPSRYAQELAAQIAARQQRRAAAIDPAGADAAAVDTHSPPTPGAPDGQAA
jgi:hypothetical protein